MEIYKFEVPSFKKLDLETKFAKLIKKAKKYGNDDISIAFGQPFIKEIKLDDVKTKVEYIEVSVSGSAPKIRGWELLGRVEFLDGENLIHNLPGTSQQIEERFRTFDNYCEHCKTSRTRNNVYIFTNGEKQIAVGRSCLRDFMGYDDPALIVQRAQFFEDLKKTQEDEEGFSWGGSYSSRLSEILSVGAAFVKRDGYISKAKAMSENSTSTPDSVKFNLSGIRGFDIQITDEERNFAKEFIEFYRGNDSFDNTYMENVRVITKQDVIADRHVAIVVGAISSFFAKKKEESIENTSTFVGTVKERLRGLELTIEKIIYLGCGPWGSSYLHLMKDASGNVFSWITTNKLEEFEGKKIKLDATIKEHKEYNGVKQTVLTRAKQV